MTLADELEAATAGMKSREWLPSDFGIYDVAYSEARGIVALVNNRDRILAALRDADRLREALMGCAKVMCIRMFWGADRPCPEYAGRDLCPTCLARAALSEPVPADHVFVEGFDIEDGRIHDECQRPEDRPRRFGKTLLYRCGRPRSEHSEPVPADSEAGRRPYVDNPVEVAGGVMVDLRGEANPECGYCGLLLTTCEALGPTRRCCARCEHLVTPEDAR